ncbi:MAG: hypothetical protein K6F82_03170 [Sphaerochaetaceae bacterium]|nr:hypothetical protein [Sphaerochaetaceae bacterium]
MKKFIIVLLILAAASSAVFADTYYEKGDTLFSVNAGVNLPCFMFFPNSTSDEFVTGFDGTHLSLGGYVSLSYQGFLSKYFALGGQIGYGFNYSKAKYVYATVPITAKVSYIPVQNYNFDLKINANAGISVLRYNDQRYLSPFMSLTVAPTYYFSTSWGIGLEAGVWSWLEYYSKSSTYNKWEDTCIGMFAPVTVCLTYRH